MPRSKLEQVPVSWTQCTSFCCPPEGRRQFGQFVAYLPNERAKVQRGNQIHVVSRAHLTFEERAVS